MVMRLWGCMVGCTVRRLRCVEEDGAGKGWRGLQVAG